MKCRMIRFACRGSLPKSASIKRSLSQPALAAGLAFLLATGTPAVADFFGIPDQPRIENSHAGPTRAAKAYQRREAKRHQSKANQEQPLPQGPFQIVVAIARQQVTLYGQNGPIAHAAISTGEPSHPTPLGVFSVISKHKWHQSNIYSGAPMPYMQRITWSGIALHAGPLPGYPASHGCIRLPQDFAIRLWGTTKVGARVIVTREPAAPVEINHPNLFVPKKPAEKVLAVASAAKPTDSAMPLAANLPGAARPIAATTMTQVTGSIAARPIESRPVSEPPRQNGPVSVFVSRKQNRLFVRQGFVPLFDLPLTIAEPDRPLGTHVFTAMTLKNDGTAMRWTVVSIPSSYPHQTDHAGTRAKKASHERREPPVAGTAPQAGSTAAEALDRIQFPPEAIEQISALLSPGASLIVSDNALSDETDSDTDFIVLTQ
jgi:hypothetical protein